VSYAHRGPSPIHGHRYECAAFCSVHPSHMQLGSSTLPISFNHCHCRPCLSPGTPTSISRHSTSRGEPALWCVRGRLVGCPPLWRCQASASVLPSPIHCHITLYPAMPVYLHKSSGSLHRLSHQFLLNP